MKAVHGESEKTLDEPEDELSKEEEISSLKSKPKKSHQRSEDKESYPIWVL
jgi:hypothetical protein